MFDNSYTCFYQYKQVAINNKEYHELRAVILPDGTQQILREVPEYKINIRDISNLAIKDQQEIIEEERNNTSHAVFDITKWPLFEIKGVQLTDTKKYLFISYDLMVMDSASAHIFISELMDIYKDTSAEVPELEYNYHNFVSDLNTLKEGDIYTISKDYWKEKLVNFPQAPNLNYKKLPSEASKSKFNRLEHKISSYQWDTIKEFSKRNGTTSSAVLLTVYGDVLSFWSNQKQLAINLTVFNRYPFHKGINEIIGDFTSIVLIDIDKTENFWEESRDVQTKLADALEHRFYDGVEFIRDVAQKYNIPQGKTVMPIVFTSLLFENDVNKAVKDFGEIKWSIGQTPQVFIDLQAMEEDGQLKIYCDYVEELFDKEVIEQMFNQYISILLDIAKAGEVVSLSNANEGSKILEKYNDTDEIIIPSTLDNLFIEQALKNPNNIAVQSENGSITYLELHEKSNQIANYLLLEKGLKDNQSVGVIVEREIDTISNIMGILKAGGKYIAINPDFPKERRDFIANDSNCLCILDLNTYESEKIKEFSTEKNTVESELDNIAYIIYTSGSTGNPKGVMITHAAVANTIIDINQKFNVTEKDRIIGLSSMCFDLSVYDIFGALSTGATLIMIKDQRDAGIITDALSKHNITIWNSVPAIMEMTVENLPEGFKNSSLRHVLLSGDWIPLNLPEKIKNKFINTSITSLGGATEVSIWSIYYPIHELEEGLSSIPYGMPLANQKIYILNFEGKECPIGVKGVIYIGGIGVAEGYLNNKELTDKSFIINDKYDKIYNTGDYGVFHPEGYVEFLGRIDQQIKIRGFRVELGEIETTLREYPMVQEAVVNVFKTNTNSQQLIGYVVGKKDESSKKSDMYIEEIKDVGLSSSEHLPDLVIPEQYEDFMSQLDNISTYLIFEALKLLGVNTDKGNIIAVDDIVKKFNIMEDYSKLIKQWMNTLVEDRYAIRLSSGKYEGKKSIPNYDTGKLWQEIESHPMLKYWKDVFNALKLCSQNTMDLLVGEKNAVEYLFPEGDLEGANSVYRYSPVAEYKNNIVRDLIATYIKNKPDNKKIRILEFGAGTGGTTASILPVLPKDRTEYVFTDISSFFTNEAKKSFKEYEFIQYDIYNIDEEPQVQGFEPYSYDIIIGANVLHDAKDLSVTVKNFNKLLTSGGMLIVLEITNNSRLIKISTGYLNGFCSYSDERLEYEKTLLTSDEWKEKFESCGLNNTMYFPPKGNRAELFREHIILGVKEDTIKTVPFDEVKQYMLDKLPEYMVPSRFMQIDEIPLTANGKVDRKKLPVPSIRSSKKSNMVEPATDTEKQLAELWKEVLEIDNLSIEDEFFDLGGDSLKAIKLVSKMKEIKSTIELADIFNLRTVQRIAKLIESTEESDNRTRLIQLRKGTDKSKNLFFIHGGSGNSSVYLSISNEIDERFNCYGVDVGKYIEYGPKNLKATDIAKDYVKDILRVQEEGEFYLAGWCVGGSITFEIAHNLEIMGKCVEKVFLFNSKEPGHNSTPFSYEGEIKIFESNVPNELLNIFTLDVNNNTEKLWKNIAEYIKTGTEEAKYLRNMVSKDIIMIVSNINDLPPYEFINKVNLIRSFAYCRDEYQATETLLNGDLILIRSKDESAIQEETWSRLCSGNFNSYYVTGNHVTMLYNEGSKECADIINGSIK